MCSVPFSAKRQLQSVGVLSIAGRNERIEVATRLPRYISRDHPPYLPELSSSRSGFSLHLLLQSLDLNEASTSLNRSEALAPPQPLVKPGEKA
jgi:hypothetical protein